MNRRPELDWLRVVAIAIGTTATVWLVVLAALAWSRWYFLRPGVRVPRWLDHAQRLSYPFYILHQTVILVVGWAWLSLAMGPWPRFAAVLVSSFVMTWALSELVARIAPLRPLFGLAFRRRPMRPLGARVEALARQGECAAGFIPAVGVAEPHA